MPWIVSSHACQFCHPENLNNVCVYIYI
uniref:Uncharacterized protein n=1 Tax=Rhizophora mucronata TaxID=61149 RepID=A0A2P2QV01_RHIMU